MFFLVYLEPYNTYRAFFLCYTGYAGREKACSAGEKNRKEESKTP